MFVGTSSGRVATFKLLPEQSGGYAVHFVGNSALDNQIIALCPINVDNGEPAAATQDAVASLRSGNRINGVLLAVAEQGARIFRPATAKGAHKTWDDYICYCANVCRSVTLYLVLFKANFLSFEAHTFALVGVFGDGTVKAFSVPGLKEIASADVSRMLDIRRISESLITPTGFVFAWTGPSELIALNVWGTGQDLCVPCRSSYTPTADFPELDPLTSFSTLRLSSLLGRPFPICNGSQAPHL